MTTSAAVAFVLAFGLSARTGFLAGLSLATYSEFGLIVMAGAVERELREGTTVFRYRGDDGLPGTEGGFHLMTSWLVDSYLATGREPEARELFGGLLASAGRTGLLSEEQDPVTGRSLGNHPQAYSHLGPIHNALNLDGDTTRRISPTAHE